MSEYDTSGKGQKDRATEILARMGFRFNGIFGQEEEWVLTDPQHSNSMISLSFKQFEYDKGLELGFWWISPWVDIDSEMGGRLGSTYERYSDVERAATDERNSDEFIGNLFRAVMSRKNEA